MVHQINITTEIGLLGTSHFFSVRQETGNMLNFKCVSKNMQSMDNVKRKDMVQQLLKILANKIKILKCLLFIFLFFLAGHSGCLCCFVSFLPA